MKAFAALKAGVAGLVELPLPEPKDDEALVKIEGCVVCNSTDWMVIRNHFGAPDFPVAVGHESIGRVVKVGKGVKFLKVGDRVTRANAIPSGYDGQYYSAWGGFAEYGVVRDKPPVEGFGDLPLEKAGLLIALSETASCLMQMPDIRGKDVLVAGTGIAGLSLIYFARRFGMRNVYCMGKRAQRLDLARRLGADRVFFADDPALWAGNADGPAVDYVFEASGKYDVFRNGIPLLKEHGTLAIYGAPERPYEMDETKQRPGIQKLVFEPKEDMAYRLVCSLLHEDDSLSSQLMTHRWAFADVSRAFEEVARGEVIKGIVTME